jgi:hypothetical protein
MVYNSAIALVVFGCQEIDTFCSTISGAIPSGNLASLALFYESKIQNREYSIGFIALSV